MKRGNAGGFGGKKTQATKEEEILERQRQLASRMTAAAAAGASTGGDDSSRQPQQRRASKPKPPPPPRPPPPGPSKPKPSSSFRMSSLIGGGNGGSCTKKQPVVLDLTGPSPPLAPSLPPQRGPPPASSSSSSSSQKRPEPPTAAASSSSSAAAPPLYKRATKKRTVSSVLAAGAATASASSTGKPETAEEVVSAARAKVVAVPPPAKSRVKRPSPQLTRKVVGAGAAEGGASSSLLANLVKQSVETATGGAAGTGMNFAGIDAGAPTIQPDDFWKHLREWDFLGQLYREQMKDDDINSSSQPALTTKPLPDTFLNARHYVAAWAPLCQAECRAQLLQELGVRVSRSTGNKGDDAAAVVPMVAVRASSASHRMGRGQRGGRSGSAATAAFDDDQPWLVGNESGTYLRLDAENPRDDRDWKFQANEIVLLLKPEFQTLIADIYRGQCRLQVRGKPVGEGYGDVCGLIGHVEQPRGGINGLVIKVSARKWATIGTSAAGKNEMLLLSLGTNVTALREFTALCSIDQIPMKQYLLGRHLQNRDADQKKKISTRNSADVLLERMGGTQALGAGFVQHARSKFNASQLTAIAASANEYGDGGFTLIKGPPGTGKTTTLVAVLNSLHIRQYNKYYEEVRRLAATLTGARQSALELARKCKPRLLVCAPSNAAVDNIILKIMEDGFVDGQGNRYNPSMIRVGIGQSDAVSAVSLETEVDKILKEEDPTHLEASINGYRIELSRITQDIAKLRRRCAAILAASPWPLSKDWEIRVEEETFEETGKVYFVNHRDKSTTYEVPPPPEPDETQFPAKSMPEYRSYMSRIVKLVESYFNVKMHLERCTIVKGLSANGTNEYEIRRNLETHVLDSVHLVMTTLGTAGNRTMEAASKFEVVVVDEAAQSVEPATLSALYLGSRHAVLVGDPQQLPATIFNVSGRNSNYDRSLFQRLEEAGQPVYMLNEQYRMHPQISHFPRHIFYGGNLLDGPNVRHPNYGNPLRSIVCREIPNFKPFTILDLDSREERGGTSLSNRAEAMLAVYLYHQLSLVTKGLSAKSRVAVITPYAQQSRLLQRCFEQALGPRYADKVEVNTVDAFQGREANVVIFSAVRAAGSHGIGFLSDVRRMNVALTRAKHFLFVLARCKSIVVNPYWNDLVQHARETSAVIKVPMPSSGQQQLQQSQWNFGNPATKWTVEEESTARVASDSRSSSRKRGRSNSPKQQR